MNWCKEHLRWNNISSALLALVTLLAMAPYDLGQVSTLFPPAWKPWVFILGALGTCASRLSGGKEAAPSQPTQIFYTFNYPTK